MNGLPASGKVLAQTALPANGDSAISEIKKVLASQALAWNVGDIEAFMESYWNSPELMFVSKNGVVKGWDNTLARYKKSYPDQAAMGKLAFDVVSAEILGPDAVFLVGRWQLERDAGPVGGYFTLLWKRVEGRWLIVADHTS